MAFVETARAKVNLTLRVVGRRADGFHEIESLVAFAQAGDTLALIPGGEAGLEVGGPFAGEVGRPNLVLAAAERVRAAFPGARAGTFRLTKRLPVAAGIGGGSADAAAALRLLARANPALVAEEADLLPVAASLGADVAVCLYGRPAIVRGIGERIEPMASLPPVAAVLATPAVALATGTVYAGLEAPPLPETEARDSSIPALDSLTAVIGFVQASGNDLEAPALRLAPAVGEAKAALAAAPGCRVAGMSGSGPTCFGLFAPGAQAESAAQALAAAHPDWWVRATTLG